MPRLGPTHPNPKVFKSGRLPDPPKVGGDIRLRRDPVKVFPKANIEIGITSSFPEWIRRAALVEHATLMPSGNETGNYIAQAREAEKALSFARLYGTRYSMGTMVPYVSERVNPWLRQVLRGPSWISLQSPRDVRRSSFIQADFSGLELRLAADHHAMDYAWNDVHFTSALYSAMGAPRTNISAEKAQERVKAEPVFVPVHPPAFRPISETTCGRQTFVQVTVWTRLRDDRLVC